MSKFTAGGHGYENENMPRVERSMMTDCLLSCGLALVIVCAAFLVMERVLIAFVGSGI